MHLEQNSDTSGKIYEFFRKIIILYKMLLVIRAKGRVALAACMKEGGKRLRM